MQRADQEALGAAQAERAGVEFQWHVGRVLSMGVYELGGGRDSQERVRRELGAAVDRFGGRSADG